MPHTPNFFSFAGYTIAVDSIVIVSPVQSRESDSEPWGIRISLPEGRWVQKNYSDEQAARDARAAIDATLFGLVSEDEPEVVAPEPAPTDWTKASAQEVADEINRRYGLKDGVNQVLCSNRVVGRAFVNENEDVVIFGGICLDTTWIIRHRSGKIAFAFQSILS